MMDEQTPHQCPHLGILDDPSTSHSFPSTWNACFHSKHPSVPHFEQQEKICLTDAYVSCPVYQAAKGGAFPVKLQNKVKPPKQSKGLNHIFAYILGMILLVALSGSLIVTLVSKFPERAGFSVPGLNQSVTRANIDSTALIKVTPTVAWTITPTATISLTATPTIEPTPVMLKSFLLEIPFKIDGHDFLIHRIKDGDGLDILAKTYHTMPDVIQASNFGLKIPIWTDTLMIIRPDLTVLDASEPAFQVYEVTDKLLTMEELAEKLSVDLVKLKYYNGCTDRCTISRGTWVLVPYNR